ncbi:MAG: hypothetical protein IMZ52_06900, partial [Actinobacteria bacterium]|nr:hypothetical protein [Actinomycetota bacterium]
LLSEYRRRIEKIKTEEELERIKLDEIKELKKKVFVEYEQNKGEFEQKVKEIEQKQAEIDIKSKEINEKQAVLDEKERQLLGKNLVIQLDDGDFVVVGKDDVEIVSDGEVIKNVNKSERG